MSDIAIRAANLSKLYHIGRGQGKAGYRTLRESMVDWAKAPLRWFSRDGRQAADDTIWALRDVSFEVKRGEVVGIIGRNGAGKSTLLKILSRITDPTEGTVDLYGRVGSLLEVGTGFHPELTGRENIYLNGAILGMKRTEIIRKFDEIVDFAEIEKFLDTPVKHYSSGMYVRLAFAVAAHLDPEILLVDEVLAVGDVEFQKKCLGKMGEVAREGRTVLFVSHNMGAIMSLCRIGILLQEGGLSQFGPIDQVVQSYINVSDDRNLTLLSHPGRKVNLKPHLSSILIVGQTTKFENVIQCGDACQFIIETVAPVSRRAEFSIGIYDLMGTPISHLSTGLAEVHQSKDHDSRRIICQIEQLNLVPGNYYVNVAYSDSGTVLDHVIQASRFQVIESNYLGTGKLPPSLYGKVVLRHRWQY